MWARVLERLRVLRGLAGVGCAIRSATAVLVLLQRVARASAGDALSATARHTQLRRARAVQQVSDASGVRTVGAGATLWNDQHRQIVTVDETDVVEVLPRIAVKREFRECCRWRRAASAAVQLSGATIAGHAGKFPRRILVAVRPPPKTSSPRRRRIDAFRFTTL